MRTPQFLNIAAAKASCRQRYDAACFKMQRFAERAMRRGLHFYWRLTRGMTLGVRGLVIDPDGRILLIEHTYVSGWHLPGGGVEPGETLLDALARELKEECNVELLATPQLHGVFFNSRISRRDHVVLFVITEFLQPAPPRPNREIKAHGFFATDELPGATSAATRARIAEVIMGAPVSHQW